MIKIYCMPDIIQLDITNLVKSVNNAGDSSTLARKLTVTLAYPIWDTNQPRVEVPVGSILWMLLDGVEIFRGIVWTTDNNSSEELTITAFDYLIYLNKSKVTYNFKNIMPEEATRKICAELGIETADIQGTGVRINRLIAQKTACEAILEMYNQVKADGFLLTIIGTRLNVIKKAQLIANYTITINKDGKGNNAVSVNNGETLEGMVNKVKIYDANNNFSSQVETTALKKYGTIQDNYIVEADKNPIVEARKLLKGIEKTQSVEVLGNWTCQTGFLINAKIFYVKRMEDAKFLIDGDTHTWDIETNKYTMQLNLVTY